MGGAAAPPISSLRSAASGWGGEIVIDGPTGHILRVPTGPDEEHLAGLPAARDLESFLTKVALYVTGLRTRSMLPRSIPSNGRFPTGSWER
ncbi:hypothetical protein AB0I10_08175 [Streptomyces sp. NPDC050636]|uniref:hypothetical protein n=1 Tax=Streptomyces sp. NPDC050636 TaxID=3154510 RepID=UPI003441FE10